MGWSLVEILNDDKAHAMIRLPFTIGRSRETDVPLPNLYISKHHAVITQRDNALFLTDTSMNGTFLNNVRLERDRLYEIKDSDIISLCYDEPRSMVKRREDCFVFQLQDDGMMYDTPPPAGQSGDDQEMLVELPDSGNPSQPYKEVAEILESVIKDIGREACEEEAYDS